MSADFEKEINAYYQSKEPYTKLLFDPSARKPSDLDGKKDPSSTNAFEDLGPLLPQTTAAAAQKTKNKADFQALFEGKTVAEMQAAMSSATQDSRVKKTMPILTKR